MPRRGGYRSDKDGIFRHVDKPLAMQGASWVEPQGSVSFFEDFAGDTIADYPTINFAQSGTPLTAAVQTLTGGGTVSAGAGGWIGGKSDDVDAEIDEVWFFSAASGTSTAAFRPERAGNGLMVMEMGFVIPVALTARQYFCGWSDAPTRGTAKNGPLNITGTYATVADDTSAAGWIFSSLATNPTVFKYASANATVVSAASAATEVTYLSPALGTNVAIVDAYVVCRVEVDSAGNAYFHFSNSGATGTGRQAPVPQGATALAVPATTAFVPKFTAAPTTTTGVEWEIDYCFAASAR